MLVNNLEIKKLHIALMGVAMLAVAALAATGLAVGAPTFELYYNVIPGAVQGYLSWSALYTVLSYIATGSSIYAALAFIGVVGGPISVALRAIGTAALRYYIRRYGLRAVTSW